METENPKIYQAIADVILATTTFGKDAKLETGERYGYRSHEGIVAYIRRVMTENHIVHFPQIIDARQDETTTKNGARQYHHVLQVKFDLVHTEDGSMHSVITQGESLDMSDKGSNKAMTAAEKYMYLQVFKLAGADEQDAQAPEILQGDPAMPGEEFKELIDGIRDLELGETSKAQFNNWMKSKGWSLVKPFVVFEGTSGEIYKYAQQLKDKETEVQQSFEQVESEQALDNALAKDEREPEMKKMRQKIGIITTELEKKSPQLKQKIADARQLKYGDRSRTTYSLEELKAWHGYLQNLKEGSNES